MSADVITFGCRLNAYESEVIHGLAGALEDTVVVNTCAVTAEAERQARQAIRRICRERPGARVVVTGCAAQIEPAAWAALPGVTRVLGNAEKMRADTWAEGSPAGVADIMAADGIAAAGVHGFAGRARALVQVQQGCDHACTFCVIPLGRGRNRSVPVEGVIGQVRALVAAGYREAVLTGVDVASYGADLPELPSLGVMVRQLLAAVPGLARLRLSSVDPAAIDTALWDVIRGEERFMPHLHLSLQSASSLVLKRMRRRHSPDEASEAIGRARALRPGMAIGADLIAGFPTETDALFEETARWVERHALPYLHVFPYSERPATPAVRMPPVAGAVRRLRAARLRDIGQAAAGKWHADMAGRTVDVLTEAGGGGHTPHFAPVRFTRELPPGLLVRARVTGACAKALTVEAI